MFVIDHPYDLRKTVSEIEAVACPPGRRCAHKLGVMQFPQRLARFNRFVTNPIQRLWAGRAPLYGILEHVGRRSGKAYRTPLTVFSAQIDGQPGIAILLPYGLDRDWLKNVTASGGGQMRSRGRTFGVANPQIVSRDQAAEHIDGRMRRVVERLPFEHAVLLTETG